MIEIHEPMRLLFVIETTESIMNQILLDNEANGRLCRGAWVRLAIMDPETGDLSRFEAGKFVPYNSSGQSLPVVNVSHDWFAGHREHLVPAFVTASDIASTGRMNRGGAR